MITRGPVDGIRIYSPNTPRRPRSPLHSFSLPPPLSTLLSSRQRRSSNPTNRESCRANRCNYVVTADKSTLGIHKRRSNYSIKIEELGLTNVLKKHTRYYCRTFFEIVAILYMSVCLCLSLSQSVTRWQIVYISVSSEGSNPVDRYTR